MDPYIFNLVVYVKLLMSQVHGEGYFDVRMPLFRDN